jgi:hypothetical protein
MEALKNQGNVKRVKKVQKKVVKKQIKERKFPPIVSEYISFYKENLRKKHAILYIITMVMFFAILSLSISKIDVSTTIQNLGKQSINASVLSILKDKAILVFMIIFAGITPFVYIPVLGVFSSYMLANDIVKIFSIPNSSGNIILMSIGAIIEIFGIALAISAGIYYCGLSSKKFRYDNSKSFGLLDLKKAIHTITKNNKKVEEVDQEIINKNIKKEKLNVKINYKCLLFSFILSFVIVTIGAIISII